MNIVKKIALAGIAGLFIMTLTACAPEVGSERWCKNMQEKDKSDWTMNEASDYTKSCLLK